MSDKPQDCITESSTEIFDANKSTAGDGGYVPAEDRREETLEFLADHQIPLPPKAIYRAMKVERNINFSYRTVQNILSELSESGLVAKVDMKELDDGNLVEMDDDANSSRAYYMITNQGVALAESDSRFD